MTDAHATPTLAPPGPLELKVLRTNYLKGPNMWTYREIIEVWLDLGILEEWPSNRIPGFNDRLLAVLPTVGDHFCGVGHHGGFLLRLKDGTWMGHVLEHVIIEMLNLAGMPTGFGQTRETHTPGVYRMVFRARNEEVGRVALQLGLDLMHAVLNGRGFNLSAALEQLRDVIDRWYLGPSTAHIVSTATERGIPHLRLNKGNLVQLGYGARQTRIWTAETDHTSAIAQGIAGDKDMTKRMLSACGLPVPEGRVVDSPAEAWDAAQDIGLPVVVKPTDANHGRGVALDLTLREEVEAAWHVAMEEGSEVLVERFIPGVEHRVLVVGGKVVAAAKGELAFIVGDGTHTVEQLIDLQINSDPRRGEAEECPLNPIVIRKEGEVQLLVQQQGLSPEAVPEAGRKVLVSRKGNVSFDCTDEVHPEVARACSLAAKVIGLDITGIDLVCEDISRPLEDQGGAIVEVNAGPGLLMHLKPIVGQPRPVGDAIIDQLFPEGETGRIPIVGISGSRNTTEIARLVGWLVQLGGHKVGVACRDGLFVGARCLENQPADHWEAGRRMLINRSVEAAVFENSPLSMVLEGYAYDRCKVGIVTDTDPVEALNEHHLVEPQHRYKLLRTQVDVVRKDGTAVLNAADEKVLEMAELSDGGVILYAQDASLPGITQHTEQGGQAVVLEDRTIVLITGSHRQPLLHLDRLKRTARTLHPEVLLASVGAGWAMGLSAELLALGLSNFEPGQIAPNTATLRSVA